MEEAGLRDAVHGIRQLGELDKVAEVDDEPQVVFITQTRDVGVGAKAQGAGRNRCPCLTRRPSAPTMPPKSRVLGSFSKSIRPYPGRSAGASGGRFSLFVTFSPDLRHDKRCLALDHAVRSQENVRAPMFPERAQALVKHAQALIFLHRVHGWVLVRHYRRCGHPCRRCHRCGCPPALYWCLRAPGPHRAGPTGARSHFAGTMMSC